jgi:hypothetical protein
MPRPPSTVALPPSPRKTTFAPARMAERINCPVPKLVSSSDGDIRRFLSKPGRRLGPFRTTAQRVFGLYPHRTERRRPRGSRALVRRKFNPTGFRRTSNVPSPPSARGKRVAVPPARRTPARHGLRRLGGREGTLEGVWSQKNPYPPLPNLHPVFRKHIDWGDPSLHVLDGGDEIGDGT